jgi:metallo-beta-lactamase class B
MDHTGGLAQLKKDSGAQLVSGEKDKPLLEGGYYPGRENEEVLQFPPVKVDRVVHEGDTVSIGNITLTAHETPGHTPGCTSWTTAAKDGDATRSVIFFCSATVALNKLVTNPTYPGIIDDYKKTFAWSKNVIPTFSWHHTLKCRYAGKRAKIADGAPNPFVKPGELTPSAMIWKNSSSTASPSRLQRQKTRNRQSESSRTDRLWLSCWLGRQPRFAIRG